MSFAFAMVCWYGANAGRLDTWEVTNFKGVWEIRPSFKGDNLSWLIQGLISDFGDSPITKVELALDSNGWGYLSYESEEVAGIINICGTIFTTNPNRDCDEVLSFLCRKGAEDPVSGIRSIRVVNPNNGPARPENLAIRSMDFDHYAPMIQISVDYTHDYVDAIDCSSIKIQYQETGISVADADNAKVAVYGIDGILQYQTDCYKGETIRLVEDAIYIIKIGDNSMKFEF